jgi:hypothetical protein
MVLTSVLTPRKKPRKKQNDDFFNKNDLENDQKVFFIIKVLWLAKLVWVLWDDPTKSRA